MTADYDAHLARLTDRYLDGLDDATEEDTEPDPDEDLR